MVGRHRCPLPVECRRSYRRGVPDSPTTSSHPPLEVIAADDRLVVFNKPTGLLSVPGIGPEKQDCLVSRAQHQFPGARIVHRLDRDTSGVIILALDADTHRELSRQFHDRETKKRYIAVVAGIVQDDEGEIDLPMRKDMDPLRAPRQLIDHTHGRRALTKYRVLERLNDRTRVALTPITGRSHQLRLHLLELGHAILGDDLYAPDDVRALADRLLLHAESLTIIDPATGSPREFIAPCPF